MLKSPTSLATIGGKLKSIRSKSTSRYMEKLRKLHVITHLLTKSERSIWLKIHAYIRDLIEMKIRMES
jgi:hypothetical protein